MISLVNQDTNMESNPPKLLNNNQEAAELLGLSSSDSLDSPSFTHFQAPKQKRKVRFKKPFRPSSRAKAGRNGSGTKSCNCSFVQGAKIFSYFLIVAVVGALLWYVMSLSTRVQELQDKFADFEAGNRNTPEALHLIHSTLRQLDSNVTMLYIEVRKNIADIENITCEVKQLKEVSNNLKESIAAAPAIQQLPKDVHSLSESVASFGSKMNALESNIKELKDQQSALQTTAQNLSGELDTIKVIVQELNNSTDFQTRSVNTSVKDLKLHNAVQETNQYVHYLQG
ncbi:uncharacterized protein LOC118193255, partial [Stegodyphus dumicola]|uniref:uncharacterized protein LOC118193255 n=1 Tax=Stegodyphus dumicola TaxID=202533 RepID=UPI0015ACD968